MMKVTYKREHLIWVSCFLRVTVHDHQSGQGAWQQAGRHDAEEGAESSHLIYKLETESSLKPQSHPS